MKRSAMIAMAAAGALCTLAVPAWADVKAGVDAWARGNYAAAVKEWRDPAAKGDPDAQFNLAQAYRLGRGVEQDQAAAQQLYAKAAAQGHIKAADNYGLVLFDAGEREKAMPYLVGAADRGDPRAQYLIGIAHFNGDLVAKDWVRAYALLTLANGAGLPQAAAAIGQMDGFIPLAQREEAQVVAAKLKREADARRTSQLAAADLASEPANAIGRPGETVRVPLSVAKAQAAVAEAKRAGDIDSPAHAGASFAKPHVAERASQPARMASIEPAQAQPVVPAPEDGPWRVQLGAFGVPGNADRLWSQLSSRSEIAGKAKILVPAGKLTRLLAGGFASQASAQSACSALKSAGHDCIVTR